MAAREPASLPAAAQPHFDEIAGMDAAQVQRSVDSARVRHAVQIAADQALAELNQLMCTMLGLEQVQLERNPLRPAVYVDALATALGQLPVAPVVRQGWLSLMSGALGQELDIYYRQLCADLHERGVAAEGATGAAPAHADTPASPDTHALTLERLRQLLVHGPDDVHAEIAQQFHPEFEDTVDATAPPVGGIGGSDAGTAVGAVGVPAHRAGGAGRRARHAAGRRAWCGASQTAAAGCRRRPAALPAANSCAAPRTAWTRAWRWRWWR